MRKKLLKKIACFTAAAMISNVSITGNVISAAAVQRTQIMNEKGAAGWKESEGAARPDNLSENVQGTDDGINDPQNSQDQDSSKTPDGANTPEESDKGEISDGTNDPKEPDTSETPDGANDPEKTDTSETPDGANDPEKTDTPETPDGANDPEKTDKDDKEEPKKPTLKKPVLKAASKPNGTIKLSWGKVSGAAEYVLLCSTKKDSGFHRIYATNKGAASYKDSGRVAGKVYYYQLAVFSKGRESRADSKIVAGRALNQVKLTGISNISGSRKLVLEWNSVEGAEQYQILRKNESTGKYEKIGKVKGAKTTYTDSERDGGTIYSYRVYAEDAAGGRGNYSEAMSQMAIDQNKKMIALTYDDGPSAHTPIVLDALAKNGGHATFFVVGNQVDRYADSVRRAVALGCEIGNHTYAHGNLKNLSAGQVQSAVSSVNQSVKNQAGVDIKLLRPPYGSYNSATSTAAGMPIIMWSIDTLDWKTRSTSASIQCVQQKAYDGAIVLMHDLHYPTAMAADTIMKYLKDNGYQLVTISEMAAYRGGLKIGKAYSQFRK